MRGWARFRSRHVTARSASITIYRHTPNASSLMGCAAAVLTALRITPLVMAADFNPFQGPPPVIVFIQSNPWGSVIGADTPRLVVYEDGNAIFGKMAEGGLRYQEVALDENSMADFRAKLKPVFLLKEVKSSYNLAPNVTDQPQAMFYLRDGRSEVTTIVYGLASPDTKRGAYTVFPGGPEPSTPPEELLKLHAWLCQLDFAEGTEWAPKYVEVMLSDYSYAPETSIQWPSEWPALASDRAIKRGDSYSIFLDGTVLPRLREFLASRKPRGAVEVDGKKLAPSYRYTFPSEPIWRNAFAKAAMHVGNEDND